MRSTLLVLGVGVLISIWISVATCKQIASETRLASAKTLDQEIQDEFNATVSSESFSVAIQHKKHRRYIPFARPLRVLLSNTSDCPEDDGDDDDFPDFLDIEVVKHGGFILCILIGIYCFTLLAVVCDNYFLPCVETICDILGISPDVAAATFMSVATSCPELFTNIIGTFVTESDLGIGTIVGSSLFNGLGVAAIGGLAAPYPLQLDWWPLTRDCTIYIFAICCLVVISWDGVIYWYEASILFVVYFAYFIIIFNSKHVEKFVKRCIGKDKEVEAENPQPKGSIMSAYGTYSEEAHKPEHRKELERAEQLEKEEAEKSLFRWPTGTKLQKFIFYYTWPLRLAMLVTIPNPKIHPRLFPITFVMCIVWIGCNAYVVSWMISILGSLTNLPDAVLGMTILAAGGCLPESISMIIISRRGEGAFGVSNSLGANTMNIIFSLGMPWFFKTVIKGANESSAIHFQSGSIEYTILALIFVALSLYITLATRKFRLGKLSGCILLTVYLTMVVLAILSELVFFPKKC